MVVKELSLHGVFLIHLEPKFDERGYFTRTYDVNLMKKLGIHAEWVQENHSKTIKRGTIRGLHIQLPPFSETKLIRCLRGKIFDVFVDLRYGSESFGKWGGVELSEDNFKILYIPRGFAHGFCTLTDNCEVYYKVDNFYNPEFEIGILWNDVDINIDWPINIDVISEKDKKNISLKEFITKHKAIK